MCTHLIDWLVLTARQPDLGYFMQKGKGITFIVIPMYIILYSCFLRGFFYMV